MELSQKIILLAVAALMLVQAIFSMRTAQSLLILGSALRDMTKIASKDDGARNVGEYGNLREVDLSIHFGVEMILNGARAAWPANDMSPADFCDLVVDWISETGRQDLTLEEISQSIKRGDHKGADGKPYSPR